VRPVTWQRNAIFNAVAAGGLDVSGCTFDYEDASSRITHVPSQSYFLLEGDPGNYMATAVVGDNPSWPSQAFTWAKVEERVQRWAEDVKRDVETPDLWAELQRERDILTGARYDDVANTPFTTDEQAQIAEQLRQIKTLVQEKYSLSDAQTLLLEARLNDVEAAARHMGRKDWLLLFLGGMFGVFLAGVVPPDAVQHILAMALHGLDSLFARGGGPLLPPPMT
jgi:hypothetical protein